MGRARVSQSPQGMAPLSCTHFRCEPSELGPHLNKGFTPLAYVGGYWTRLVLRLAEVPDAALAQASRVRVSPAMLSGLSG